MGGPQELVNRPDAKEPEAAIDESAGVASEGLGIARDRDGGSDRRRCQGLGHGAGTGAGRVEDDGVVSFESARVRRIAGKVASLGGEPAGLGSRRGAERANRLGIPFDRRHPGVAGHRQAEGADPGIEIEDPRGTFDPGEDGGDQRGLARGAGLEEGAGWNDRGYPVEADADLAASCEGLGRAARAAPGETGEIRLLGELRQPLAGSEAGDLVDFQNEIDPGGGQGGEGLGALAGAEKTAEGGSKGGQQAEEGRRRDRAVDEVDDGMGLGLGEAEDRTPLASDRREGGAAAVSGRDHQDVVDLGGKSPPGQGLDDQPVFPGGIGGRREVLEGAAAAAPEMPACRCNPYLGVGEATDNAGGAPFASCGSGTDEDALARKGSGDEQALPLVLGDAVAGAAEPVDDDLYGLAAHGPRGAGIGSVARPATAARISGR